MAIVINGSGTVAGLAVGGLPDDTVDAGSLANSINSEITANTAKTGITSAQATAITAALPKAGGTMTGHLLLGDNDYIQIGNSQDLKIFHDSSNSYINDTGTGDLIISGGNNVRIKSAGGEDMIIATADDAVTLYFNNAAKIATSATGVTVSGAVAIGGTGTANQLDDYEEGTWTPAFAFGGGTTGISYLNTAGNYTKIGRRVNLTGYIQINNKGSSTGNATLTGFPFTSGSGNGNNCAGPIALVNVSFADHIHMEMDAGTVVGQIREIASSNGAATGLTNGNFTNDNFMRFAISYNT